MSERNAGSARSNSGIQRRLFLLVAITAMVSACGLRGSDEDASAGQQFDGEVALGAAVDGSLDKDSSVNLNDGSRGARYAFRPDRDAVAMITVSASFCGRISLFDLSIDTALLRKAVQGGCEDGDERNVFRIAEQVGAGETYLLVLSGQRQQDIGAYQMTTAVVEMHEGAIRTGGSGPETVLGFYEATYPFIVGRTGKYQLDLSSNEFDPALELLRGNKVLVRNDDGGASATRGLSRT